MPAVVPALAPLILTPAIVAPFAPIAAATGVAYGLATATVVAGKAGAAASDGADSAKGHSHLEHRNVSADRGTMGAGK